MRPCFLADENLNAKIITGLLRREPAIDFKTAKSADLLGSPDPEVLLVAARENRILVSHDRDTMAAHFSSFIETARSSGLIIVSQKINVGEAIEQILLVWAASEMDEWVNRVAYLPL